MTKHYFNIRICISDEKLESIDRILKSIGMLFGIEIISWSWEA